MKSLTSNHIIKTIIYLLTGTVAFSLTAYFNTNSPLISGIALFLYAVISYFYIVFFVAERNWLDIRAVFHAAWIGTIALASLRLTNYQQAWKMKTWVLLLITYVLFQIGAILGIKLSNKIYDSIKNLFAKIHIGKIYLAPKENRLFLICVITTLIGLGCFIASIAIRGFVPCFSKSVTAYVDFYTKFHIFSVASTAVSGLCFYCIRTQKLSWTKRIILGLCILYLVFIFPIMIVSRGVFITAALSLVTAIFYTCGKKLWVFCLSIVLIAGIYMSVSSLRNYTDAQLNGFFDPAEIEIDNGQEEDPDEEVPSDDPVTFKLSPKAAFLYSYLTVGHDNFDLAVKNVQDYTFGARQMVPFNVILRSQKLTDIAKNGEYYLVRPYLNTVNLIGDAYYDFHEIGIILFALLWSFIFGMLQTAYLKSNNCFLLLLLGNTMIPVAMCFFSPWLSIFTHWMLWGTVVLLFIAASITVKKKS